MSHNEKGEESKPLLIEVPALFDAEKLAEAMFYADGRVGWQAMTEPVKNRWRKYARETLERMSEL